MAMSSLEEQSRKDICQGESCAQEIGHRSKTRYIAPSPECRPRQREGNAAGGWKERERERKHISDRGVGRARRVGSRGVDGG